MPSHTETTRLPYSPQQLFALVLDIEQYPEFLPWCRGARIVSRDDAGFVGELIISFAHLTERYSSRVVPHPPQDGKEGSIEVSLVRGPFSRLTNRWKFVPCEDGTELHFYVDFAFKTSLLDTLIGGLFARATEKMTSAFIARAKQLYG